MSRFPFFIYALAVVVSCTAVKCSEQAGDTAHNGVVLLTLSPPVYPRLAAQAHISGDVDLTIGIREDGTVESAVAITGHPMLKRAALDSAQQSQFECRGCSDAVTSFPLVYTFQLAEKACCAATDATSTNDQQKAQPRLGVTQSGNHVTVIAEAGCNCDPGDQIYSKVRSAKCLYLWRCGVRK